MVPTKCFLCYIVQCPLKHHLGICHRFHRPSIQVHQKLHHLLLKDMHQTIRLPYQNQLLQVDAAFCYYIISSQMLVISSMLSIYLFIFSKYNTYFIFPEGIGTKSTCSPSDHTEYSTTYITWCAFHPNPIFLLKQSHINFTLYKLVKMTHLFFSEKQSQLHRQQAIFHKTRHPFTQLHLENLHLHFLVLLQKNRSIKL